MKLSKLILGSSKILAYVVGGILGLLMILLIGVTIYAYFQTPRLDRNWYPDVAVMPTVAFSGNLITISNIRNTHYRTTEDYSVSYYDQTFDLTELDEVRFVVEPFSDYRGPAHTFLSFGFTNSGDKVGNNFSSGEYVSISIETRKEVGEHYDPLKGLAGQYELMYVIASEQDVIGLRANHRKDQVYLYPINTSPDKMRQLFIDMVTRANELRQTPEFYNTIYPNCTSSIRSHINKLREDRIPFSWKLILPSYSNELAYDLGLIKNPLNLTLAELQQQYHINTRATQCPEDESFSTCIRQ